MDGQYRSAGPALSNRWTEPTLSNWRTPNEGGPNIQDLPTWENLTTQHLKTVNRPRVLCLSVYAAKAPIQDIGCYSLGSDANINAINTEPRRPTAEQCRGMSMRAQDSFKYFRTIVQSEELTPVYIPIEASRAFLLSSILNGIFTCFFLVSLEPEPGSFRLQRATSQQFCVSV